MSQARITDLYEVTMAHSYLLEGMLGPATFGLAVRRLPPGRGFLVAAGLESVLDFLEDWQPDREDIDAFAAALDLPTAALEPLARLRFTGEVRAVPEGRAVFADEPLLEVTAPLPVAQLVESFVLNQVCHQTAVASKAARSVLAACGTPVVDFGLRRAHGLQAAEQAARLGALVGFTGTSNVDAAHRYGLTAVGTMAHSYVEAFADEAEAFRAFIRSHPGPVTLLVDTYDTERGVATAAEILRQAGLSDGCAIRLDSGDLDRLARVSRKLLDGAGLPTVSVVVSGGLDEYGIQGLVRAHAPVDLFAVGTLVAVSADAPYLDAAYKLVSYDGRPVMKTSAGKVTMPGAKQVHRGPGCQDVIALREEPAPPGTEPLLETVMAEGRRTGPRGRLSRARTAFHDDLTELPPAARRIESPDPPVPAVSASLAELTEELRRRLLSGGP